MKKTYLVEVFTTVRIENVEDEKEAIERAAHVVEDLLPYDFEYEAAVQKEDK